MIRQTLLLLMLLFLSAGTSLTAWGEARAEGSTQRNPKLADLVDLHRMTPRVVVDLKYATDDNFMGRRLYDSNTCFLNRSTALKVDTVQKELEKMNLGLKVWDCYRPLGVQQTFWAILPDERYVANPKKGSRHNRACAVDVTLVDSQGKELQMPTGFDDFSPRAHHAYRQVSATAVANRALLKRLMEKAGFVPLEDEWWHYDDDQCMQFDLIDIPFQEILKHQN